MQDIRTILYRRPSMGEIMALRAQHLGLHYRFRLEDGLWVVRDHRRRQIWAGNLASVWAISGGGIPQ